MFNLLRPSSTSRKFASQLHFPPSLLFRRQLPTQESHLRPADVNMYTALSCHPRARLPPLPLIRSFRLPPVIWAVPLSRAGYRM
ncbi:unnamed protein product [Protopolystoma xenopodis]|uniref:Uncharacterized protein n=1 Tax=Protopolystoma xenopodis TaxID=117903 RepID=A0A448XS75_9PLAT|nr:unnamed protein product [Protopolystoma xenopodis]